MEPDPCIFTSVLEFYYGLNRTASYDVQVLATSLNQYLHQVFLSLDFHDSGVINKMDFVAFLTTLDLTTLASNVAQCSQKKLSYRAFHEYIGQYYAALSRREYVPFDCGNTEKDYKESLRALWTIGRNTVAKDCLCHSQNSTALNPFTSTPTSQKGSFTHQVTPIASLRQKECIVCSQCQNGQPEISESDELDNLREVVEELRTSLQIADAKKMALQVKLQQPKHQNDSNEETLLACSSSNSSGISSGDAADTNDHYILDLQVEVKATRKKLYQVTQQNKTLVYYVEKMVETFEKTKSAILSSLERVRNLESQAKESVILETRVLELQRELERTRKCIRRNSVDLDSSGNSDDSLMSDDKRELSMEECRTRVEDLLISKLQDQVDSYVTEIDAIRKDKMGLQNYITKLRCGRDHLAQDLKATESERVRLSILEEKLIDVVGILRHMKSLMLPRATVGELVMQALGQLTGADVIAEECVMNFVQSLLRKLTAYELTFTQANRNQKWMTYV